MELKRIKILVVKEIIGVFDKRKRRAKKWKKRLSQDEWNFFNLGNANEFKKSERVFKS